MRTRTFGDTDLAVSEICYGPMRFSAKTPGDDAVSRAGQRAFARAMERGVDFIHSSYEYDVRWAMEQVLRDHPKRHALKHVIKVPVPDWDDGGRFDKVKFRIRIEEALRDLHTECIHVVQHLHRAKPNTDDLRIPGIPAVNAELVEVFEEMRAEGKVGHLTCFPYTPDFARAALDTGAFKGLVAYYNPIEMEMAGYFDAMQAAGQGFLCIRPFMSGLLTDRRVDRDALPADDRYRNESWDAAYARLELVKAAVADDVAAAGGWLAFATQFCLAHPVVASLIVGLNTEAQVDQVIDAAEGPTPGRAVFDRLLALYDAQGALTAPAV